MENSSEVVCFPVGLEHSLTIEVGKLSCWPGGSLILREPWDPQNWMTGSGSQQQHPSEGLGSRELCIYAHSRRPMMEGRLGSLLFSMVVSWVIRKDWFLEINPSQLCWLAAPYLSNFKLQLRALVTIQCVSAWVFPDLILIRKWWVLREEQVDVGFVVILYNVQQPWAFLRARTVLSLIKWMPSILGIQPGSFFLFFLIAV